MTQRCARPTRESMFSSGVKAVTAAQPALRYGNGVGISRAATAFASAKKCFRFRVHERHLGISRCICSTSVCACCAVGALRYLADMEEHTSDSPAVRGHEQHGPHQPGVRPRRDDGRRLRALHLRTGRPRRSASVRGGTCLGCARAPTICCHVAKVAPTAVAVASRVS